MCSLRQTLSDGLPNRCICQWYVRCPGMYGPSQNRVWRRVFERMSRQAQLSRWRRAGVATRTATFSHARISEGQRLSPIRGHSGDCLRPADQSGQIGRSAFNSPQFLWQSDWRQPPSGAMNLEPVLIFHNRHRFLVGNRDRKLTNR